MLKVGEIQEARIYELEEKIEKSWRAIRYVEQALVRAAFANNDSELFGAAKELRILAKQIKSAELEIEQIENELEEKN